MGSFADPIGGVHACGVHVPRELVSLLREISGDLGRLGEHAAQHAANTRTAALGITLEAVKAGLPPGKLRELAQRLRQDAGRSAELFAHDRARISLRIAQAVARASTLAREKDLLGPTRDRAALLAGLLWQVSRELQAGVESPWLVQVARRPGRIDRSRAVWRGGLPSVEVGVGREVLIGSLNWEGALRDAWFKADSEAWMLAVAGKPPAGSGVRELPTLAPRVWLLADSHAIASSHAEEVPGATLDEDVQAGVVSMGARRVAIARLPGLLPGLQDWSVVCTHPPRLREAPRRGGGEVIQFPGL